MDWVIPRMWENAEVWILGGGSSVPFQFGVPEQLVNQVIKGTVLPSVYSPYMEAIHNKHVIAINAAYLIGNWMSMIFFGDKMWFLENEEKLAKHPAVKVACHPNVRHITWVKHLERVDERVKPYGLSLNSHSVVWNGNSGAAAISVAAAAGAKRIILVGFDMFYTKSGNVHWHDLYDQSRWTKEQRLLIADSAFKKHLMGFPEIAIDARIRGIEIINASPDSTITAFPKRTVKDLLS